MRRLYPLLAVVLTMLATTLSARASLYDYSFSYGSSSRTELSDPTTIWRGQEANYVYGGVRSFSIGFDFTFDGVTYDYISVSSHGAIGLGTTAITSSESNYLADQSIPTIAPLWDAHRISGTRTYTSNPISPMVTYEVQGAAGNRVLIIDFDEIELVPWGWYWCDTDFNLGTWQVRLYERGGKIEFWYGDINACDYDYYGYCLYTSATIGIANGRGEWISVIPWGSYAEELRDWPYDYVDLSYMTIDADLTLTFQPCQVTTAVDRTVAGSNDTVLIPSARVKKWDPTSFQPIRIENVTGGCRNDRNWRVEITGPSASEYVVTESGGWLYYGGSYYPEIIFTPTGTGVRRATLTITDDNYYSRSFKLEGVGISRVDFIPDLNTYDGGGTPGMVSGDTLMHGILVPRPEYRDFHPVRLYNSVVNPDAPPASIRVTIDSLDLTSEQFVLQTASTIDIVGGDSYTPIIRFLTLNVGYQEARITIECDGETRWYLMRPISVAPAIEFTANNMKIDAGNPLFQWTETCVGEQATSTAIVIRNSGTMPLDVRSIMFWLTDTVDRQGTPPFPLMRDSRMRTMVSEDYAFSDVPGIAPISANSDVTLPFTLQPGETRTIYATFVAQYPGKRYARAFLETNAQNVYGSDTAYGAVPGTIMGLANVDLVGRGVGSSLAADPTGLALGPLVFSSIRVGDTLMKAFTVANTGICDLRINREQLRIFSGDVHEFKIIRAFAASTMDADGNYVLPAGALDSVWIRFIPSRSGTRMATIRVQTNDSTIHLPGVAERGSYYLDLHGRGRSGLDGLDLVLQPSVIGSFSTGLARFESTMNTPVEIQSIFFEGDNASEFSEDASGAWPLTPSTVLPGAALKLGVRLTPVGDPGMRRTTLVVVSTTGDSARINVRGEAGTQVVTVSPASLFDNVSLGVGQAARQTVVISNNGTLPIRISSVQITGTDVANYRLGRLPRLDLGAGASEYLEITYAPETAGQSSATLEIVAAGVTYSVALGGESSMIRDGGDPTPGANGQGSELSPAGVFGEASAIASVAIRPNPAVDAVTLTYRLAVATDLLLEVYDASGALVRRVDLGSSIAGSYERRVDVSMLSAGVYRFALTGSGSNTIGSFTIAR